MTDPGNVPNAGQLTVHWYNNGSTPMTVWGLQGATVGLINQTLADQLDTLVKGAFTSSGLASHYNGNSGIQNIAVRNLNIPNSAEFLGTGGPVGGTLAAATNEALPLQTSMVITLRTAQAGRSFRGRSFIPAPVEAANLALGVPDPTALTAAADFINAVRQGMPAPFRLGIVSKWLPQRPRHGHPDNPWPEKQPFVTEVVAAISREQIWGTQRRRTGRR